MNNAKMLLSVIFLVTSQQSYGMFFSAEVWMNEASPTIETFDNHTQVVSPCNFDSTPNISLKDIELYEKSNNAKELVQVAEKTKILAQLEKRNEKIALTRSQEREIIIEKEAEKQDRYLTKRIQSQQQLKDRRVLRGKSTRKRK